MAYLLGGEYCIESLRQDVKDLENTLCEVQSRVGQVLNASYPPKVSVKLLFACNRSHFIGLFIKVYILTNTHTQFSYFVAATAT